MMRDIGREAACGQGGTEGHRMLSEDSIDRIAASSGEAHTAPYRAESVLAGWHELSLLMLYQ